ncbi:MAG: PAS domain S-box protein [Desulfuromonadales bacterium]|nr:PAS domain S-box protein [Desulfuromonadales bacterium]
MGQTLKLLIIEDSQDDFLLVERHLRQQGLNVSCSRVDSAEALERALDDDDWNLVLSDFTVPGLDFKDSFSMIRSRLPDLPVILVSGSVGEEQAVELLKLGVHDFVLKDKLTRLVSAVQRSLKDKRELEERRRSEELLRESEERYRTILQTAMDGFWLMDTQGNLLEVNETYCRMSGYNAQELLAMRINELVAEITSDDISARIKNLMELVEGRYESRHRRKDGNIYDVEVSSQYRPVEGGRLVIFLRDITERKQAEKELHKKNAEIEQFIYTVSHDLRSPLVTVKTFMGYLEKDMVENNQEQLAQDIKYIHGAADKMKLLLDELLELSRIGRIETPQVSVSLMEVLVEVLNDLAGIITEHQTDIQLPDTDLMLFGDRSRLCQIWQNLIENAIKYSRENSIPRIELGVCPVGGETVFFVKDNGIGIDPHYQSRIFGIFEKLDPKSPGAGMGLSMVRRIVEKYGGRIWVESEGIGKGSSFLFTLPQALVPDVKQ